MNHPHPLTPRGSMLKSLTCRVLLCGSVPRAHSSALAHGICRVAGQRAQPVGQQVAGDAQVGAPGGELVQLDRLGIFDWLGALVHQHGKQR